ncbi:MAG: enoyl-CoA hydratase/isomerase family protein [Acidimicrobiales bacterium]|nr:enoyl-CoA hydratase/isomerase family protein [Acidimicrobiales bacterium]
MANVELSSPAPQVTQITLNRPDKLNALTYDLVRELHEALQQIDADQDCRAVILTGAGRGFCAGLDLGGFGTIPGTENLGTPQQGMAVQQFIATLVPRLRDLRQPVISAINGPCAGGGFALALASDIRVCSTAAKFGTAFVRLGLSGCDIGVSWMLPRLIGASRAWELLLTGRVFDAAEADKLGLVTECVPPEALMDTALTMAERIKANSPFGVWMTKEVMWSNLETGSLQSGIDLENRTQLLASHTQDCRRTMTSVFSPEPRVYENR